MNNVKDKIVSFVQGFSDNPEKAASLILETIGNKTSNKDKIKQKISKNAILITYANQIIDSENKLSPILAQQKWLDENIDNALKTVHILPFFPFSSDAGFSVMSYKQVNPEFGSWEDINKFEQNWTLMFDLVVNHCSSKHHWFLDYLDGKEYCKDYFIETDINDKRLKDVVRPRTSPLVHSYQSKSGVKNIWTTFSQDQVDLNFANPDLLAKMIGVLFFYVEKGMKYIRLDAITFAIKKLGTSCSSIDETHQLVKLFRYLLQEFAPDVCLITETNVPHQENISYFGNGDETQMVYNFPLPPLLVHATLRQNVDYLYNWAKNLDSLPEGCAYFNMTATHDGIGVRGASAEIPQSEINYLGKECLNRGGQIVERTNRKGEKETYELNITYFDILTSKEERENKLAIDKFMLNQLFALSLKGVPGVYFHNLFANSSWQEGYEQTGKPRTLNRQKFTNKELDKLIISNQKSKIVFEQMKNALNIYHSNKSLGAYGKQQLEKISETIIKIKRTTENGENLDAYFNFSDNAQLLELGKNMFDLLTNKQINKSSKIEPWQVLWLIDKEA